MDETAVYVQAAEMLIGLGLATAAQIRDFFTKRGADDDTLAAIMAEVDRRIARRS